MSDLMALDYQASCLPVYEVSRQPSHSSLQSSISQTCCTDETHVPETPIVSELSDRPPIPSVPQRRSRPITIHQSLPAEDDSSLRPNNLTQNTISAHDHRKRRHSCPGIANQRQTITFAFTCEPLYRPIVHRWDGRKRTVDDWDGLRRDPELWVEDGDCYVHLHGNGTSRRGPSFLIPLQVLRDKNCGTMLNQSEAQAKLTPEVRPQMFMCTPSATSNSTHKSNSVHLFFPPPEDASREDSFKWHISTRNFFAFLLDKPLVGEYMGEAFVDLQERVRLLRPEISTNRQDFLDYADKLGYRDLVDCTDLALANLFYAEHYKLRDVWIDAFAHCVGMHDSLALSPEFSLISKLTKALIARAHHEVIIQMCRVTEALGNFLDEDLSPTHLGLTPQARSHLDRFRKLLHDFYSEKFGYWPPNFGSFPKLLYKTMHKDFKTLYDYLVDTESTIDLSQQKPASGGICVLQNIISFDKRHTFNVQPHPLPLLPTYTPPTWKFESQNVLRQWKQTSHQNKTHKFHTTNALLAISTNTLAKEAKKSKIMQVYMEFESGCSMNPIQEEEKLSAGDARKVRWLLIYGTLQYLECALRAPKEVRDIDSPDYPLCCLITGQTSWNDGFKIATASADTWATSSLASGEDDPDSQRSPNAVQPDCQRADYFSPESSMQEEPADGFLPLKLSRSGHSKSMRALSRLSLSARTSRRISLIAKSKHSPILLPGYGNGLNEIIIIPSAQDHSPQMSPGLPEDLAQFDMPFNDTSSEDIISRSATPLLEVDQVNESIGLAVSHSTNETPTRSDSTGSTSSSIWSQGASAASSESSTDGDHTILSKANVADNGGLLGGLVSISDIPVEIVPSRRHTLLRRASKPEGFHLSFNAIGEETSSATPSSPPLPIRHQLMASPNVTIVSPIEDLKPSIPSRSAARFTSSEDTAPPPKRGRGTDIMSALTTPTTWAWDQYKATLSRPTTSCAEVTLTPSTKPIYTFKLPSLKFAARPDKNEDQTENREKRFSMPWRR